ncbi:uncharacterized protein C9orf40 homolog isoform X1 [Gallus gallus]|uniref:uncharacterized protein C9orf40 homolog isoform X1 n=1 Tax=Gallus gallus TaxID=9031 RepID=UPI0003506083|nr:uncharacterized protein C9orf40 homolog isoform X1 [Gallus gallus]XP_046791735.1 uncharacterized protein C9orf40 homolog isoform X1 [Gallus gallus]|eukprot:XP_004949223.1 uncharacterized protein C9orf40 homolog isoform X1 [Gallus gallus]
MAKRRAEPLVCYAPFKRLLREPPPPPRSNVPERRPRNEAAGAGPAAKRKLEEAEAPPGKRPGLRGGSPRGEQSDAAGRRRRRGEPAAPQDERTAEGSDGRRGEEPAAAPVTQEEFNQYNSFLYWRAPLPTIDLSDIQSLHGETTSADKTPSRTDTMETEMET